MSSRWCCRLGETIKHIFSFSELQAQMLPLTWMEIYSDENQIKLRNLSYRCLGTFSATEVGQSEGYLWHHWKQILSTRFCQSVRGPLEPQQNHHPSQKTNDLWWFQLNSQHFSLVVLDTTCFPVITADGLSGRSKSAVPPPPPTVGSLRSFRAVMPPRPGLSYRAPAASDLVFLTCIPLGYVPPKSVVWNPNLQCDGVRRWGLWWVIRSRGQSPCEWDQCSY